MRAERTQVAIVGAGPAGLVLGRLLELEGVETVVLERRSREHVEHRIRAGVLEQGTVDLLRDAGVGERMEHEGLVHHGIHLQFDGERHHLPLSDLTGGRTIVVYGQTEVVKDLIAARLASGVPLHFEVSDVAVDGFQSEAPSVRYTLDGEERELRCDVIAGCDGYHGVCRPSIPDGVLSVFEREHPYGWLGILAEAPPSSDELVYAHSERGFALLSLRSPTLSRLYLQCAHDEDPDAWPDERIWDELERRAGPLNRGEILEKGVTGMRSFVCAPMQHGRLYLTGDAAHIVPPTGAKGLNLAIADVRVLAEALVAWYRTGREALLAGYSTECLRRVWRAQLFSTWMTGLLHRPVPDDPFAVELQRAELRSLTTSEAAARRLAENYTGLQRV